MSREFKPGDVALVTLTERHGDRTGVAMLLDSGVWEFADGTGGHGTRNDVIASVRPLVVIDPEDREQVERLFFAYRDVTGRPELTDEPWSIPGRRMQVALRSLIEPPRPDEPTTWGVVEASCVHDDARREWMRHADGNWYVVGTATKNNPDDWDSLVDPVVIREGVTP